MYILYVLQSVSRHLFVFNIHITIGFYSLIYTVPHTQIAVAIIYHERIKTAKPSALIKNCLQKKINKNNYNNRFSVRQCCVLYDLKTMKLGHFVTSNDFIFLNSESHLNWVLVFVVLFLFLQFFFFFNISVNVHYAN